MNGLTELSILKKLSSLMTMTLGIVMLCLSSLALPPTSVLKSVRDVN